MLVDTIADPTMELFKLLQQGDAADPWWIYNVSHKSKVSHKVSHKSYHKSKSQKLLNQIYSWTWRNLLVK